MGVAFAEVSPDFCVCINTHCHCCIVLIAARGFCDCYACRLHACSMGMGATERFYVTDTACLAGGIMWAGAGADVVYAAGVPS